MEWHAPVYVSGATDRECQSLIFGFCQNVVVFNVNIQWTSGRTMRARSSRTLPARDADDDVIGAPWYSEESPPKPPPYCDVPLDIHIDDRPGFPQRFKIPWDEPGGVPLSLKLVAYDLQFDTFLVQRDQTGRFTVRVARGWSIQFIASVDWSQQISKRVTLNKTQNVQIHQKPQTKPDYTGQRVKFIVK